MTVSNDMHLNNFQKFVRKSKEDENNLNTSNTLGLENPLMSSETSVSRRAYGSKINDIFSTASTFDPNQDYIVERILTEILEYLKINGDITYSQYIESKRTNEILSSIQKKLQDLDNKIDRLRSFKNNEHDLNSVNIIVDRIKKLFSSITNLRTIYIKQINDVIDIVFVHEDDDKVRALYDIHNLFLKLEEEFPEVSFDPSILHINDNYNYEYDVKINLK